MLMPGPDKSETLGPKAIYSAEAERAVLGCMIAQPGEVIPKAADALCTSDFFVAAHREIFRTVCTMFSKGESVDVMTVHQRLVDNKVAEAVGSPGILAELLVGFATHLNVDSYISTVTRESRRRKRLEELQKEIQSVADDPDFIAGDFNALTACDANNLASDATLVEPPILVGGVLHKGSALLLGAASKSYKSWSLIDLGISVANGAPWWGQPCTKGRVLVVDFELTRFFWVKRATEIAQARGMTLDGIRVINCRGYSPDEALRAIEQESKAQPFDLICIDPLYSFLAGKDENSAGDVGAVLRRLAMLSEKTGAALAVSHHFSKGNQAAKESIDRFSGSGVFARFPDALLTMTRHEEDSAFTIDPTVRNFAPIKPFVLRWEHPLMVRDGTLDPSKVKKSAGVYQSKYTLEQVLGVFGQDVMTSKQVERACFETHGMSDAQVKRFLKKAKDEGILTQPSTGLWQRLTGSRQRSSCP
jgi:AAA domain/DnaB-like helicase N terminal domain